MSTTSKAATSNAGKKNYNGEHITYNTLMTFIGTDDRPMLTGHSLYITELEGRKINCTMPDDGIWVMNQDDEFQTFDNFCTGVNLIDKYATPTVREKCFKVLTDIRDANTDINRTSQRVAFFCEVGVWQNAGLRNKHLFDNDFRKYLYNVRWNYQLAE